MAVTAGQFLVNYSAANVRLFFRIYFILLGITVGFLGKACTSARAKVSLSRGKDVNLTRMVGWLGGLDSITTVWKIRAFPGGFLMSSLMIVAYIVSLASDLVGTYIRSIQVHDRCLFGTGLVLAFDSGVLPDAPWNGSPYGVASQAQTLSLANEGQQGIYTKVNRNTSFSADDSDVLGAWHCTQNPLQLVYSGTQSRPDIGNDLLKNDLLYSNTTVKAISSGLTGSSGGFEHFVLVDTSNQTTIGSAFDIRVCASTSDVGDDTKTMICQQCTMSYKVGWLQDVLKAIDTNKTFTKGLPYVQGSCYDGTGTPVRSDMASVLERAFNSIVMVSAGKNYLLDTSQATSTQGCLTSRTWILWEVLALAAIAAFLNIFLAVYFLFAKTIESKRFSAIPEVQQEKYKNLAKTMPGDLLGWMTQAIRESKGLPQPGDMTSDKVKEGELKSWVFGWMDFKSRFGVTKDGRHGEDTELLAHGIR